MDSFPSQLKQVFRRLRRAPMFTFITLFTLAAGIGANIAVFSVLEGILLKPLAYPQPEQVRALDVTDGTLPLLGVSPVLGRLFTRQDDSPSATKTVLVTYGYWQSKFGAAPSTIGRTILVDGTPRQIIGVLPQKFQFLDQP